MNLSNKPLYHDVAERLRAQIFAHTLPPGSWLDEQSLAVTFGISRTPMREAIKVLASEGLVTMKPRRGAYVTEVERGDLEQIFAVLAQLEGFAAQLNQLDNLHLKLEKAAAERDEEQFFEINVRFHELVMEIAGNRWMNGVVDDLRKVLKLQRRGSLGRSGRLQSALNEHRNILKALIKRDGAAAQEAMQAHLARGLEATR